jgi:hypothetical protein
MALPFTSKKLLPVSRQVAAAIVLMQSGISDLSLIATAVGLTRDEVERIDAADDPGVRKVASQGPPEEFVFRLRHKVTCPMCGSRIYLVPCMSCKIARLRAAESRGRTKVRPRSPNHPE